MRIFHRRCRLLPGKACNKETPQRLTASDQAVMAVGKRKHRQEGNRLAARTADPTPNRDPVMLFVMSLFPSTTVPHHRIQHANRTPAEDSFRRFGPIGFQLALRHGEWNKNNRATRGLHPKADSRTGPSSPCEISTGKRISNPRYASHSNPWIGRLRSQPFQRLTGFKFPENALDLRECGDFCGDAVSQW
jgi:hypothetical protein